MTGGQDRARRLARLVAFVALGAVCGCAGRRPAQVTPEEIPTLEERLRTDADNVALRSRYAAALFAADRCEEAVAEGRRVLAQSPREAVAILVIGQCQERQGQLDSALATYRAFLRAHAGARGAGAVRAREMLAFRTQANQQARLAIQNEAQLSQQPGDPNTIAVLPLEITGDTSYLPLSRGLAQILTSDLALIERFRLVERLQLASLMDELNLAQGGRVDPTTTARVGRLVQAGRMVQGAATIPPRGETRLEARVVLPTGEVMEPAGVAGRFRDLLRIEKDLVITISARLGYVLSEAERRRVLENGTQNLTAFLAYSRGLLAEDAGDFSRAAAYFGEAVRADPGFQQARESYQAAVVADAVQEAAPSDVVAVAEEPPPEPDVADVTESATSGSIGDLAPTQAEKAAPTTAEVPTPPPTTPPIVTPPPAAPPPNVTGTIRIVFRLP
jgi:tetratricopeptide (TPR) repeat protein